MYIKLQTQSLMHNLAAWDVVMKDFRKDALFNEIILSQQAYAKKVMKYLFMNQPNYRLAYTRDFW